MYRFIARYKSCFNYRFDRRFNYRFDRRFNYRFPPNRRSKRALDNPNKKKSCSLYIQTDPLFWRHIREQEGGDDAKTEEEILSLIAQHVKAVNRIYSDTPFDGEFDLFYI